MPLKHHSLQTQPYTQVVDTFPATNNFYYTHTNIDTSPWNFRTPNTVSNFVWGALKDNKLMEKLQNHEQNKKIHNFKESFHFIVLILHGNKPLQE